MTPEELDAIETRLNAATPGAWRVDEDCGDPCVLGGEEGWETQLASRLSLPDATFIAHAPDDLRRLLAEVRRLQANVEPALPVQPDHWTTGWENPQGLVWWFLRGSDGVRRARSFPCSDGTFGWDIPAVPGETYPLDAHGVIVTPGANGFASLQDAQRAAEEWLAKNGGTP